MIPTASAAAPVTMPLGTAPWALASQVEERLRGLAARYDAAAQQLEDLASRLAVVARQEGWTGPGSRAFEARAQRHGTDTRQGAETLRQAAELVRLAAAGLGERIRAVEALAELGGGLAGALASALGTAALGAAAPGAAARGATAPGLAVAPAAAGGVVGNGTEAAA